MQMVKKILLIVFVIWFSTVAFMPKKELYYAFEKELQKYDIEINEKSIEDNIFSLSINGLDIYIKGIKLIEIDTIDISSLLFLSKLNITDIKIDSSLANIAPSNIDKLTISHQILTPTIINVDGFFSTMSGEIDLDKSKIRLDFNSTNKIEMLKSELKKDEKGWYYEKLFKSK